MHIKERVQRKHLTVNTANATMYAFNELYDRASISDATFLSSNKKQLFARLNRDNFNKKKRVTLSKVTTLLQQKDPYTLHKNVIRKFKRNHYYVNNICSLYEADLVDMTMFSDKNDGIKYLLTVIDVFSKFAYVKPLKSKGAQNVVKAFREILDESKQTPKVLQTDRGSEFINATFKAMLQTRGIRLQHPLTTSAFKCAVIEVFNKTLKTKIYRFFTHMGQNYRRYIDVLPEIVASYNNTVHSVTMYRPIDVNSSNVPDVYRNTHRKHRKESSIYSAQKLQPNDYVLVVLKKKPLDRGVLKEQWSREIFVIDKVLNKIPQKMYRLRDFKGNEINGKFYEQELQKISLRNDTVMKVLKIKGLGVNKKQYVLLHNGTKKWI